jgi:hypothetical protein
MALSELQNCDLKFLLYFKLEWQIMVYRCELVLAKLFIRSSKIRVLLGKLVMITSMRMIALCCF